EAAESGNCLRAGIVVRNTSTLKKLLNIDVVPVVAATRETASSIAHAVQQVSGAEYGLGIAAFPTNGSEMPTATAAPMINMSSTLHIALASGDNVRVKSF